MIAGVLSLLAAGIAYAIGARPGYLLDPAALGHRTARAAASLPDQRAPRVVILGTSLTARYSWPEGLRAGLVACLGRTVDLTTNARPGAGSGWGEKAVHEVAAAQPDLTLIEFSINDADLTDGAWLDDVRRRHQAMVETLRAANPDMRIALVTMSPANGPRGWVRLFLGAYEDMYRHLAAEMNLDLIDLAPIWAAALQDRGAEIMPDGLHPTEAAVAEVVLPMMISQVGKIAGASC